MCPEREAWAGEHCGLASGRTFVELPPRLISEPAVSFNAVSFQSIFPISLQSTRPDGKLHKAHHSRPRMREQTGTSWAEAHTGLAHCLQDLYCVLSGRPQIRSTRVVSTESLLSRNSSSPAFEHSVRGETTRP